MSGQARTHPIKSNSLKCYLSLVNIFMKTIKDNDTFFQENLARVLWPMNCEAEFSQIWSLLKKKIELRSFSLGHFQQKIKTKYYENSRKLHLRPFLIILAQHEFLQNIHFCHLFCIWTPITVQYFSKKLMNRFQEKLVKVIRPYWRTSMNS